MMFCTKCGNEIPDGVNVCGYCGTPVSRTVNAAPGNTAQGNETQGMGSNEAGSNVYPQSEIPKQTVYGESAPSYSGQSQGSGCYTSGNYNNQAYQDNAYQTNGYQNQYQTQGQGYGAPLNTMDGGAVGLAVTSLILGIASLLLSCCVNIWWLVLIMVVLSIVFGVISLGKHCGGKGMAIAGIVCSIIAVVIFVIYFVIGAAVLASLFAVF